MSKTVPVEREVKRLHAVWRDALRTYERRNSDRDMAAEQEAYDALVDYVEAHGLNYSEYDPRGPQ